MIPITFLGGPLDGTRAWVSNTPERLQVRDIIYLRLLDPDTEEFLGGYAVALANPCNHKPGPRDNDGHGWVTTLASLRWKWKCAYCGKRSRSKIRPDKT